MDGKERRRLAERVMAAAEAALRAQGHVGAIDVLVRIGWLSPVRVDEWRQGRLPVLADGFQVRREKLAVALHLLQAWARERDLEPVPTDYVARSAARETLRFTAAGEPADEAAWSTHWVARDVAPRQRARIEAKLHRPPELVAIEPRNEDWRCHRCGGGGGAALLVMEPPGPACLSCAGLGDLEFVPSGDALLTRRARAASRKDAVVVRWSRTRQRYERIGVLVEPQALAAAQASLGRDAAT